MDLPGHDEPAEEVAERHDIACAYLSLGTNEQLTPCFVDTRQEENLVVLHVLDNDGVRIMTLAMNEQSFERLKRPKPVGE